MEGVGVGRTVGRGRGSGRRSRCGSRGSRRRWCGSGLWSGQQLGLDQHLLRVVEDGGNLGAGGSALGIQFAVAAVYNALGGGPLQGFHGVGGYGGGVREAVVNRSAVAGVVAGALGVVVQHGGGLLPGDRVVGAELPAAQAGHDTIFRGPVDAGGIVLRSGHVVKPAARVQAGVDAGHIAQYGDEHAPGHGGLRPKGGLAGAVEQALFRDVVHMAVKPVARVHVSELLHAGGRGRPHRGGNQQRAGEQQSNEFLFHNLCLFSEKVAAVGAAALHKTRKQAIPKGIALFLVTHRGFEPRTP